ncbi:hypothetical protein BJF80_00520 [Serinicoccus sp. CUA-874]|nr:hypothetical protein BJF80_00520 [Serinicoccus sp. CUA-874]
MHDRPVRGRFRARVTVQVAASPPAVVEGIPQDASAAVTTTEDALAAQRRPWRGARGPSMADTSLQHDLASTA